MGVRTCISRVVSLLTMYLRLRSIRLVPHSFTLRLVYQVSYFIIFCLIHICLHYVWCTRTSHNSLRCNRLWALHRNLHRQVLLTISHCEFKFIKSLSNSGAPLHVGAQVSQGSCWGLTCLARPALQTPGMGRCVGRNSHPCAH